MLTGRTSCGFAQNKLVWPASMNWRGVHWLCNRNTHPLGAGGTSSKSMVNCFARQSLETGTPTALFPVRIAVPDGNTHQYAVSSDGQRFLVNLAAEDAAASPTLILNWHPERGK